MAPSAPLKSAHIIFAIQPALRDCEPLLQATEAHFAFSLDTSQPISTQIESIQHCRRSALTTSRLLGGHLAQLTHPYDDWVVIIRKFTSRDDPDQVLAEQQAFQQMNEAPDGLRKLGPLIGGAGMVNAKYRQTQFIRGSAILESIRRLPDGRYSVSRPRKSAHPRLATNYGLCAGRLQSLLRSLSRQPERLRLYDETIQH
uniref:ABM domain-containing protein n=1 Tax=Ascaris lumbricoides TaxID=6252 RepID=A0A0M3HU73_ASCLU